MFEVDDLDDLAALEALLPSGQVHSIQHFIWEDVRPLLALLDRLRPAALRELAIGQCNPRHEPGQDEVDLGDLSGLWVHRELETLTVYGKVASFGAIDAPALRSFDWMSICADADTLASLAAARWPQLESLTLWLGVASDDYPEETKAMHALLDGKGLPRLHHLALNGGTLTDGLREHLPRCGILPQLKSLNLWGGYKTDRERQALARLKQHPAFAHLERFVV
jgi:hypothetical protein